MQWRLPVREAHDGGAAHSRLQQQHDETSTPENDAKVAHSLPQHSTSRSPKTPSPPLALVEVVAAPSQPIARVVKAERFGDPAAASSSRSQQPSPPVQSAGKSAAKHRGESDSPRNQRPSTTHSPIRRTSVDSTLPIGIQITPVFSGRSPHTRSAATLESDGRRAPISRGGNNPMRSLDSAIVVEVASLTNESKRKFPLISACKPSIVLQILIRSHRLAAALSASSRSARVVLTEESFISSFAPHTFVSARTPTTSIQLSNCRFIFDFSCFYSLCVHKNVHKSSDDAKHSFSTALAGFKSVSADLRSPPFRQTNVARKNAGETVKSGRQICALSGLRRGAHANCGRTRKKAPRARVRGH